jgi:succinoglycan biosynthesis transport protein ExoP
MMSQSDDLILEAVSGGEKSSFDWRTYFDAIVERWWIVLLCCAIAAAAAFNYMSGRAPVYQSTSVLIIEPHGENMVKVDGGAGENTMTSDMVDTIVQTIQSPTVYERVVDSLDLTGDNGFLPALPGGAQWSKGGAVGYLASHVKVSLRGTTRLVDITVQYPDAEKARILADAVAKEFIRMGIEQRTASTQLANQYLMEEVDHLRDKVMRAEEAMQDYRVAHNAHSLEDDQNLVLDELKSLNTQLENAKQSRIRLETDIALTQNPDEKEEEILKIPSIAALPNVADSLKRLDQRETEFEAIQQRYRKHHPTYIAAEADIQNLKQNLSEALKEGRNYLLSNYTSAQANEHRLSEAVAEQQKKVSDLNQKAIQYNVLQRDLDTDRTLFESVLSRLKETDVTKDWDDSPVRIMEPAVAGGAPIAPKKAEMTLLSGVGGILGGCGIAILLGLMSAGIKTVTEAERLLKLPVLSAIPERNPVGSTLEIMKPELSNVAESIRFLRTAVNLLGSHTEKKILMIASALPAEGKTYISCSLAAAFAQSGQRTILIDTDLRRPAVSNTLGGIVPTPGLTDVIAHGAPLDQAIRQGEVPNFWILPAGSSVSNPAELLSNGSMQRLVEQLVQRFDRVLIDTSPVLVVSDTLSIARIADAICIVFRAESTPAAAAERTIKLLTDAGCRPAGIVMNRVGIRHGVYGYNSSYYYDGRSGQQPQTAELTANLGA